MFGKPTASGQRSPRRPGERALAIANFRCALFTAQEKHYSNKDCFGVTPKPTGDTRALPRLKFDVRRWALDVLRLPDRYSLHLIPESLLVPMRPHSLAAFVLGNFCFPSFFERAHSVFQSRRLRFNHLIRCTATAIGGTSPCDVRAVLTLFRSGALASFLYMGDQPQS